MLKVLEHFPGEGITECTVWNFSFQFHHVCCIILFHIQFMFTILEVSSAKVKAANGAAAPFSFSLFSFSFCPPGPCVVWWRSHGVISSITDITLIHTR